MRAVWVIASSLCLTSMFPPPPERDAGPSAERLSQNEQDAAKEATSETKPVEADELQPLLRDRHAAVVREIEMLDYRRETGTATLEDFAGARRRLLRSKLDLADSDEERIRAWEEYVSYLEKRETHAEARLKTGGIDPIAVPQARYDRLDAEIKLLRLRRTTAAGQ